MKSSFKKIQKKGADSDAAYFGHPELDAALNNSLKKGHLLVVQQDHPTTIFGSLVRYCIGSQYHKGLHTLVFQSRTHNKWRSVVPQLGKERTADKQQKNQAEKSEIAWRYDSMNINLNSLSINEQIAWMDLSKNVNAEAASKLVHTYGYEGAGLKDIYQHIQSRVMDTLVDSNDTALRKLVLTGFPQQCLKHAEFEQFMHSIRCLARTSHLLVVFTIRPLEPLQKDLLNVVVSYSDYYLKINSDLGKAYSHFDGTLAVIKEVQVGVAEMSGRGITVWGLKAKSKRQVRIEPLFQNTFEEEAKLQQHPCGVSGADKLQF